MGLFWDTTHTPDPQGGLLSLVTSLILTRLDYGSSTLSGVPAELAPVRSQCSCAPCQSCDRITHLLRDLHWLRVPESIHYQYRLAVFVFGCRHNMAPFVMTWNSLPASVTSAPSLTVFKRQLETFLFDNSFRHHLYILIMSIYVPCAMPRNLYVLIIIIIIFTLFAALCW